MQTETQPSYNLHGFWNAYDSRWFVDGKILQSICVCNDLFIRFVSSYSCSKGIELCWELKRPLFFSSGSHLLLLILYLPVMGFIYSLLFKNLCVFNCSFILLHSKKNCRFMSPFLSITSQLMFILRSKSTHLLDYAYSSQQG